MAVSHALNRGSRMAEPKIFGVDQGEVSSWDGQNKCMAKHERGSFVSLSMYPLKTNGIHVGLSISTQGALARYCGLIAKSVRKNARVVIMLTGIYKLLLEDYAPVCALPYSCIFISAFCQKINEFYWKFEPNSNDAFSDMFAVENNRVNSIVW